MAAGFVFCDPGSTSRPLQSLQSLVEDYLADARAQGLSPKTLQAGYGFILQRVLLPWCERQGIVESAQLDNRALNRFTSEMLEMGGRRGRLSRHTVDTYRDSSTEEERAAVEDGQIAVDPLLERLADVPTPSGPTPRVLKQLPVLQSLDQPEVPSE